MPVHVISRLCNCISIIDDYISMDHGQDKAVVVRVVVLASLLSSLY